MIQRVLIRAQFKQGKEEEGLEQMVEGNRGKKLVDDGEIMTVAGFVFGRNVFMYYESLQREIAPEEVVPGLEDVLEDWAGEEGKRKWISLMDVFHFNEPESYEHWLRKLKVDRRVGRVAYLRPEMVASYVYYHYQLQEERAFTGPKYEIIGLHENLLFGYQEFPDDRELPIMKGKLDSSSTPDPWSDTRMDLHFKPWKDGDPFFKKFDAVFAYYCGAGLEV